MHKRGVLCAIVWEVGRLKVADHGEAALPAGRPRVGGGITLKLLIEEGLLQAGEGVLTSEYKGANMIANLNPDGRISYTVRTSAPLPRSLHFSVSFTI